MDQGDVNKALDEHPSGYGQYNKYVEDARFSKMGLETFYGARSARLALAGIHGLYSARAMFQIQAGQPGEAREPILQGGSRAYSAIRSNDRRALERETRLMLS
jgi:hypothetical protein